MIRYSQNDEQERIISLFKGKRGGVFLDIGANDGITLSNTYALAKHYGWCGLLIEASPKAYERLVKNYQAEDFKDREFDLGNVAIGKEDGVLEFNESGELLQQGDVALVSSGVKEELDRWKSINMQFEPMNVPMESVATMLSKSRFHKFDLISIDIEGMELDVLPQFDFDSMETKVVVAEWNGKRLNQFNQIMMPYKFRLVHRNAENLIYSRL